MRTGTHQVLVGLSKLGIVLVVIDATQGAEAITAQRYAVATHELHAEQLEQLVASADRRLRRCDSSKVQHVEAPVAANVALNVSRSVDERLVGTDAVALEVENASGLLHHVVQSSVRAVHRSADVVRAVGQRAGRERQHRDGRQPEAAVVDVGHERHMQVGDRAVVVVHQALEVVRRGLHGVVVALVQAVVVDRELEQNAVADVLAPAGDAADARGLDGLLVLGQAVLRDDDAAVRLGAVHKVVLELPQSLKLHSHASCESERVRVRE